MPAYPYDIKLTVLSGPNAGEYGFMLVTPPNESKQLSITEVGKPETSRLSTQDIATHLDFNPVHDTPFAQSSFHNGCGQNEFDFYDDYAYWWGRGVVTHVENKAFLAPPERAVLPLTGSGSRVRCFRTYLEPNGQRWDFAVVGSRIYRRDASTHTGPWVEVWAQPNGLQITDLAVHGGRGLIAVPGLTDAQGIDFYTQASVTAPAPWSPVARNHTPFNNTNGRPVFFLPVRATLFAAVNNNKIYYTVDPTQDGWVGPIEVKVGSITSPNAGDASYPFHGLVAVNDYLFCLKADAGYSVDSEQNVTEVFWQWKDRPDGGNFRFTASSGDALYYTIANEVVMYDPGTGGSMGLGLSRVPGFSVEEILGLASDTRFVYVLARVRLPFLKDPAVALLGMALGLGRRKAFEVLWEDSSPGGRDYYGLFASGLPDRGTRLYIGRVVSGATETVLIDLPAVYDWSMGNAFRGTGSLWTSVTYGGFPGFSKRHLWLTVQAELPTPGDRIDVYYSTDHGSTYSLLGTMTGPQNGLYRAKFDYVQVNASSICLRFDLTGSGTSTPVLRVFDHHQRVRYRYLPSVRAAVRIGDYIELLNGQADTRTAAQLRAGLEVLRSEDGTILYEDYLGNSFNVSVDDIGFVVSRHESPVNRGELEALVVLSRADSGA